MKKDKFIIKCNSNRCKMKVVVMSRLVNTKTIMTKKKKEAEEWYHHPPNVNVVPTVLQVVVV